MDWEDPSALNALDREGYRVVEALARDPSRGESGTFSRPSPFVCIDGSIYWLKGNVDPGRVQQGLVAELIGGRLAAIVGAGPAAVVVRVTPESLPSDGTATHLLGVVVGILDEPQVANARDLQATIANLGVPAPSIDGRSRALVVAFQTWIGASDSQVLVRLTDGRVMSIDHGDCFANVTSVGPPSMVVTPILPGTEDVGRGAPEVQAAVAKIEAVTDQQILRAVAQVPAGEAWQSPVDRRLAIARWLSHRRDSLRAVMDGWSTP